MSLLDGVSPQAAAVLSGLGDFAAKRQVAGDSCVLASRQCDRHHTLLSDAFEGQLNLRCAISAHVALNIIDAAGKILSVNAKFAELSGYPVDQLVGSSYQALQSGMHPDAFFDEIWCVISAGQVWQGEICNRSRTGGLYWLQCTIVPFSDASGVPTHYIAVSTDITEKLQMTEDFRRAKEVAESANRAKSDFLANMSHEIRTPMNGVLGMTELVLDTQLDPEQREFLNIVKSSGDALLRVIDDILDFSKIEAGQLELETIPFNLGVTVSEILKALALTAHAKGLALELDLQPEVPLQVLGDPGRLRQILVNLIGNAIKFTATGKITLRVDIASVQGQNNIFQFTVADTGIGIPRDKLASIFKAFSQEDSSTTRKYGGTGLGLSISSRLVTAMGGSISVASEPGVGSQFHFSLALAVDAHKTEFLCDMSQLAGMRVLVVDDHPANLRVVLRVLQTVGANVMAVASGELAMAELHQALSEKQPFDLVLMDARMDGLDGFKIAQLMREEPQFADIKRVMMSSSGLKGDAQRALELGFLGYISKPFSPQELVNVLTRVANLVPSIRGGLVTRHSIKDEWGGIRVFGDLAVEPAASAQFGLKFDFDSLLSALDADILTMVAEPFQVQWNHDMAHLLKAQLANDEPSIVRSASAMQESLLIFNALPLAHIARRISLAANEGDILSLNRLIETLRMGGEQLLGAIRRAQVD